MVNMKSQILEWIAV